MSSSYTAWPLRFSPRPAAMIDFFATLGLHQSVGHQGGTWGVFVGRSGSLGVHDTETAESGPVAGYTGFNVTTADVESAAGELRAAGLEVRVWDETYGKQGLITAPGGFAIGLNEAEQEDLYGGYLADPRGPRMTVAASMDVVAICHTPDFAAAVAFFGHFGFVADGPLDPQWTVLRAPGSGGAIGLHPSTGPDPSYALSFETSEPLDALAGRLTVAGHPAEVVDDLAGVHVRVNDPDGEVLRIHLTS